MFTDGYAYHIKDEYFVKVNDAMLMKNKENGTYRPTFFCMRDKQSSDLIWVIPMSTKIEKYEKLQAEKVNKFGSCDTIVIGEFGGGRSAFLLQNMFPITEKYIDHVHTINGNPVKVKPPLAQELEQKMKKLHILLAKGARVVFPDIAHIKHIMLNELRHEQAAATVDDTPYTPRIRRR